MSAYAKALLKNPPAYLSGGGKYVANVGSFGQQGLLRHLDMLDSSTPLVLRQVTPVVGSVPTLHTYLENGPTIFKRIMEGFCQSLTGVDINLSLNTSGYPAGNDSQQLEAPTDMVVGNISPSMVFPELAGNPIWEFFKSWMYMIRNPITQASSMAGLIGADVELPPHVISTYACDMVLLQYDTTLRPENMIASLMVTNMFPKTLSNLGIQKELGQAVRPDRTVDFSGIVDHTAATNYIGRNIAAVIGFHKLDPEYSNPVVSDVSSILANSSLVDEANSLNDSYSSFTA